MSLPPEVIERCAATSGTHGGCHGASASGIRVPDGATTENESASLERLANDLQASYEAFRRQEIKRRGGERARRLAAQIAGEESR